MNWITRRQLLGTAALVALAVTATILLSPARVVDELAALSSRPLLFGVALAVLYLIRPLFAWPISPISALVGFVLGVEYGIPVALVGATLTCIPPYLFARYVADEEQDDASLFGRIGSAGRQVVGVTGPTRGVLAARLSPIPADPVSYGAGFSRVPPRAFLVGTFIGEIPWVILEVIAGASMHHISAQGLDAGFHILVGSAALAALVLAGPAYRHYRRDQPN